MTHRLPITRSSLTRKNAIGRLEFYVTVGFYDDEPTTPGEVFVHVAKEGSTLGGLCTSLALVISISLQHRVPWEDLSKHLVGASFVPDGIGLEGEQYLSISHAFADTIDKILETRRREFDRRTLTVVSDSTPVVSLAQPTPVSPGPPPAGGG